MKRILTFTMGADYHAGVIDSAITALGGTNILYSTTSLPGRGKDSLRIGGVETEFALPDGTRLSPKSIDAVWNRRFSLAYVYPPNLHPADRRHVGDQARGFLEGLASLFIDHFAVNPVTTHGPSINKVRQIRAAAAVGMSVPETLVSNDPEEVSAFLTQVSQGCVKPFRMQSWGVNGGQYVATTARLDDARDLPPESVALAPMIYQAYVQKAFEVRVTAFGNYYCCTRINNQIDGPGATDWREDDSYLRKLEPLPLPSNLRAPLQAIMRALNIRFGTFDFVVTPDGEWVFLEVNEAGQFLWQEQFCEDCFVVEPFARFLMSQDPTFEWDPAQKSDELTLKSLAGAVSNSERYLDLRREPPLPDEVLGHAKEDALAAAH